MNKTPLLAICSVVSLGCMPNEAMHDPRLDKIISNFELEFSTVVDYPVIIADEPEHRVGLCEKSLDGKRVRISQDLVDRFEFYRGDGIEMEYLLTPALYHELAHCSFDLSGHDDTMLMARVPASFMHSKFHPTVTWEIFGLDYYKRELGQRLGVEVSLAND